MNGRVVAALVRVDQAWPRLLGSGSEQPSPERAVALLAGAGAGLLLGTPGLLAVAAVAAGTLVGRRRRRARAERQLLADLNDAVPLLQLAVGAGLTVRAALTMVGPWSGGRLGPYLAESLRRVDAGTSLADELDDLPERLGANGRGLAAVLSAGERYGSPLAEPLARLGAELQLQRRRQLEQAARRVPVHLLVPLVLGVLPAFVLLAVVPMMAGALDGLVLPAP